MQISIENSMAVRGACLFAADKYRKAAELGRKLRDQDVTDRCETMGGRLQEIANALPVIAEIDAPLVSVSLDSLIEECNRQVQALMMRGAIQEAALFEHRLTAAYTARRALTAPQSTAAASATPPAAGTGEE